MIFILKEDFEQNIRTDLLNNLTDSDDTKLDTEEAFAMAEVQAFFGERYDLDFEYLQTLEDRNKMLLRSIMSLMLYSLYKRRSSRDVPEHILIGKEDAERWMKGVRDGKLSSSLQLRDEEIGKQEMFLSAPNRNYSTRF